MTSRTRTLLFYLLVFVFLITGGSAIFYSQGWRIDFSAWKLERTGAVFIKSTPKDAALAVNNTPVKNQSGLLENGTLIDGLLPRTYMLHLEKTGWYPWDKQVLVRPGLVTKYEHIVLAPEKKSEAATAEEIAAPINNRPYKIEFDKNKNTYTFSEKSGSGKPEKTNISALFNTLRRAQLHSYGTVLIQQILVSPSNQKRVLLVTEESAARGGIYLMDIDTPSLTKVSNETPVSIAIQPKEIIWSNVQHEILAYDFSTTTVLYPAPIAQTKKIEVTPSGEHIGLLEENRYFYLLDRTQNSLSLISTSTENFEFSPDGQKVALATQSGIVLIDDFTKDKKVELMPRLSMPLMHLLWYKDSEHLFLVTQKSIYFTEVDAAAPLNQYEVVKEITLSRDTRNAFNLSSYTASNMLDAPKSVFYDSLANTLYFVKENTLFKFSFEESVSE